MHKNPEQELKLQELPPKQAHFCLEVWSFLMSILPIEKDFSIERKSFLLAVSGGVDSMALLAFFLLFKEKYAMHLTVIHIDHSLREESATEAEFVENICKIHKLPCIILKEDVQQSAKEKKKGIEEMARLIRYELFAKALKENKCDFLVLAHHLNDLAEDVIMRQIRGTSLEKSIGMPAFDAQRSLLRPFLLFEKAKLEELLLACKLAYVEDSSNFSLDYLRNRVRHEILPLFLKENPSYLKQIRNNWLQAEIDNQYWLKKVEPYFEKNSGQNAKLLIAIKKKALQKEEKALRLRVIAKALRDCDVQNSSSLLYSIDDLLMKNESNKKVAINTKKEARISKEYIEIFSL